MIANTNDIGRRLASGTKSLLWILAAQIAVFAAIASYVYAMQGNSGLTTAAMAGVICFLPASAALYSIALTAGTPNALTGTLVSMTLRTAVPFFVTILLVQAFKPLANNGLFGMVLINYFVVLAVESLLAVRMIQTLAPPAVRQ